MPAAQALAVLIEQSFPLSGGQNGERRRIMDV
jgi:hypothetical protein